METLASSAIAWGVATLALPGHSSSGDLHVVKSFRDGAIIAVLDGIGHGDEAAAVARSAGTILEAHAGEPLVELIQRCHDALRATRGVVMSIASFDVPRGLLTWLGVGNVQGVLLRPGVTLAEECLLLRAGVVGARLPRLQPAVLALSAGDTLVFATDGIDRDFVRGPALSQPPQGAAETILARHRKTTDDALVLVARYSGHRK